MPVVDFHKPKPFPHKRFLCKNCNSARWFFTTNGTLFCAGCETELKSLKVVMVGTDKQSSS